MAMECCSASDSDRPLTILSEENGGARHCHVVLRTSRREEGEEEEPDHDAEVECTGVERIHNLAGSTSATVEQQRRVRAALPSLTHHSQLPPCGETEMQVGDEASLSDVETEAEQAALPFSKEVISFALFGRIHPKCKRPWSESLSARIADVQDCYKNIPPKLYFSLSSVSLEGIGVYAAEILPRDTSLGPYIGQLVSRDRVNGAEHNQWLWEVYHNDNLTHFVDASDPKLSNHNWMNFIQCARNSSEQNLKLTQINGNLYFIVTRDIAVGEELLVWYDEVQYGVYMGVPTGFYESRSPLIEAAAMEPAGVARSISGHLAPSYPSQAHATPHTVLSRNPTEHRFYVHYIPQSAVATSASQLSDSDSGISVSLEHPGGGGGGGPTPPSLGTLSSQFDRVSNSSGSSNHLDVTSTTTKHQTESIHHFHAPPHLQEVAAVYPTGGELYSSVHVTVPTSSPISHHQALGGAVGGAPCSPQWRGQGKGELGSGEVWLKSSPVGLGHQSSAAIGGRKQLLYGMFTRYEDGTRWQCEECKKLFSSQGSLRAHARIHTGERPYQCQYCCRTFCQASTLRSHERLHTGEKPYKCDHCGRAFTQSAGLRSHLKTHRYDS